MIDKSYMFWDSLTPGGVYTDGVPVPRVTYRCSGKTKRVDTCGVTTHQCKLVTDHPGACICICGQRFNEKEDSHV